MPIQLVARSKPWVCGRWLFRIVDSNPPRRQRFHSLVSAHTKKNRSLTVKPVVHPKKSEVVFLPTLITSLRLLRFCRTAVVRN
jgi:hypothetical protein